MILGRSQKVKQFFSQLRKDIQSQIQWLLDLDTEVTSPITTELGILRDKCKRFLSRTP